MIDTFEDVVELSIDLNSRAYPFLKGLQRFFHENPKENPEAQEGVDELIVDLDNLFVFLHQRVEKIEGKHDFSELPEREYH